MACKPVSTTRATAHLNWRQKRGSFGFIVAVQAQFLAQGSRIQGPTIDEGRVGAESPELGQIGSFLLDRGLKMTSRDRLLQETGDVQLTQPAPRRMPHSHRGWPESCRPVPRSDRPAAASAGLSGRPHESRNPPGNGGEEGGHGRQSLRLQLLIGIQQPAGTGIGTGIGIAQWRSRQDWHFRRSAGGLGSGRRSATATRTCTCTGSATGHRRAQTKARSNALDFRHADGVNFVRRQPSVGRALRSGRRTRTGPAAARQCDAGSRPGQVFALNEIVQFAIGGQ